MKRDARDRILRAASRLFQERGYKCVGINEIIAAADTAKASFYDHFDSKEDLCATWLREVHQASEARHEAILKEDRDPVSKLTGYFESLREWMKCGDYRGCPFTNTASVVDADNTALLREVESHKIFLREFFVDLARQVLGGRPERGLGDTLFLLYSGATTECQNLRTDWPIDAAIRSARNACDAARKETFLPVG